MRLSEAIRLGAMNTTQGFGSDSIRNSKSPCALGAALLAVGRMQESLPPIALRNVPYDTIVQLWPYANRRVIAPETTGDTYKLMIVIYLLNDSRRWSREKIADWVEQKEIELGVYQPSLEEVPVLVTAQ